jgi:deoxyribose-phosphate aldolase
MDPQAVASLIDHTLLKPDAPREAIVRLCREARKFCFGAVCVNPYWTRLAAEELKGSSVKVASVTGFPLGANETEVKVFEASRAISDGAREIDMVINIGALLSGDAETVERDIAEVVGASHACGVIVKVILETALLTDDQKKQACDLAQRAGADFVKTSTGFGPGGATASDVALMRAAVGPSIGVKASGGIRTWEDCSAMIAAGANRIGTSSGIAILSAIPA